ncbi:MAG: hypothetical protein QOF02_81 [Blastocatellia bacterium]|jgi:hypothetical protein|nr:hypothetical protein [Blastocatellia bacterium]
MNKDFSFKRRLPNPTIYIFPPAFVTLFLWSTSPNDITIIQAVSGFILLLMPWTTYRKWRKLKETEVPLFSLIAGIYWLYYALPLFWGDRYAVANFKQGLAITEEAVTVSMLLVLAGVIAFWLGMKLNIGRRFVPRIIPDIPTNPMRWDWLRVLLFAGTFGSLSETALYALGYGLSQMMLTLLTLVPMVAYAILFRSYLRGQATRADKILLVFFLALRFLIGMSSGWLGALGFLMITTFVIYIYERKKFPVALMVFMIIYVLFFQVGKFAMRAKYWYGDEQASKIERISTWVEESVKQWGEAVNDPTGEAMRNIAYTSMARTSLLSQTANIVELTPSTVPYQYGQTYSYMLIAFIPRIVWPDKPSANDANRFYQVAYGITAEEDLEFGSFGAGTLAEGYINFGWPGVVGLMFLLGIFFDWFQWTFLTESSGYLLRGIGVALLPYFLAVESQLGNYLGATLQRVGLILLLMIPIVRFRKYHEQFGELKRARLIKTRN